MIRSNTAGSGSSRCGLFLFVLIAGVGFALPVVAQEPAKPNVSIQVDSSFDLKLSEAQVVRLKALQNEYTPRFKALAKAYRGTRDSRPNYGRLKIELRKLRTEYQERYNAVLTKEQLVRFDSLAVATARKVSHKQLEEAKQADKRGQLEARTRLEEQGAVDQGRAE